MSRTPDAARLLLAAIRLVNGGVTLVAPGVVARRAGVDPAASRTAQYVFRLFGIRTVLIALDLVQRDPAGRARAIRIAPFIHLTDVAAAAIAGRQRQLPAGAARAAVLVSSVNVFLSLLARRSA